MRLLSRSRPTTWPLVGGLLATFTLLPRRPWLVQRPQPRLLSGERREAPLLARLRQTSTDAPDQSDHPTRPTGTSASPRLRSCRSGRGDDRIRDGRFGRAQVLAKSPTATATQIRGVLIVPIGGARAADSVQHRERVAPNPPRSSAWKESVCLRCSCTARRTRPRARRCQSLRMSRAGWRSWSAARPIANLRGRGCWPGAISQRRAPVRTWIPAGRAMGSPIRPLLTGGGWTPI